MSLASDLNLVVALPASDLPPPSLPNKPSRSFSDYLLSCFHHRAAAFRANGGRVVLQVFGSAEPLDAGANVATAVQVALSVEGAKALAAQLAAAIAFAEHDPGWQTIPMNRRRRGKP